MIHHLKSLLTVGSAVALLAALWPAAAAPAAQPLTGSVAAVRAADLPEGQQCSDVLFIGLRGSGQTGEEYGEYEGYGPEIHAVREAFDDQLGSGSTVRPIPLPYQAASTELIRTETIDEFLKSVDLGTILLRKAIQQSVDACDTPERIVLAGYSQGAWVIHSLMNEMAASPDWSPYLERITQIILVADPLRVGSSDTNTMSTAPNTRNGVVTSAAGGPAEQFDMPAQLRDATHSICYAYDMVCDLGPSSGPEAHGAYKNGPELEAIGRIAAIRTLQDGTGANRIATALIVDSSGSMGSNDPQNGRLQAARAYVTASLPSDEIGVVDFDGSARVAIEAVPVASNRQAINSAIDTIDSAGGTNLGAGLQAGCDVLISATGDRRGAIFLTDGSGSYSGQSACYAERGWPVYTIGLGAGAQQTVLEQIASETGGTYLPLPGAETLACEFQQLRSEIAGLGRTSDCQPTGVINQGQVLSFLKKIAPFLSQFTFTNVWPGSDIEMTVVSPSGRSISRSTSAPDVLVSSGPTHESFTIANPEPGEWEVTLVGTDIPEVDEAFTLSSVAVPKDADDIDRDGDGVGDLSDNCAFEPNPGQADDDGNGVGNACDVEPDQDADGVDDSRDVCIDTVLPEPTPSAWKKNRYLVNEAGGFVDPRGRDAGVTLSDTGGCSGAQIIDVSGLGRGHTRFGITRGALLDWVSTLA